MQKLEKVKVKVKILVLFNDHMGPPTCINYQT